MSLKGGKRRSIWGGGTRHLRTDRPLLPCPRPFASLRVTYVRFHLTTYIEGDAGEIMGHDPATGVGTCRLLHARRHRGMYASRALLRPAIRPRFRLPHIDPCDTVYTTL